MIAKYLFVNNYKQNLNDPFNLVMFQFSEIATVNVYVINIETSNIEKLHNGALEGGQKFYERGSIYAP